MDMRTQLPRGLLAPVLGCAGLLVWAALVSGCDSFGGTQIGGGTAAGSRAVRNPILTDIPMPAGFKLVDDRSMKRASGKHRWANLQFAGPESRDAVYSFYLEYMPSAGFSLRQETFVAGEYRLRFESSAEECVVRVRRERANTVVVLDIGPRPEGSAEREAKPVMPRP